ncbi:hypothetical protein HMPREF2533_00612 [Bacteroides fragilis]|nr:hypothetical protein HMPREF2530_00612 [Bacteroides fragilis]KXU49843.1 hypothetical protein HMPREF2533_00612 [Bacteroides fragilis]
MTKLKNLCRNLSFPPLIFHFFFDSSSKRNGGHYRLVERWIKFDNSGIDSTNKALSGAGICKVYV